MNREEKTVYMEDGKVVSLYVVSFEREGGNMTTLPKKPGEELWYLRIVKNFVLPRDADLSTQPAAGVGELSNLGICPEKRKRAPSAASKKNETDQAQTSKAKNVGVEKKERGISCVAESVLNSEELDKTVARLLVVARSDGYAQGYAECSHHVNNALKVDWDTSRSATHGVNTGAALTTLKTEFNNLQLPVMDLINVALQSEDHVAQLKEIFPDEGEDLA
ncbi:hypothetical protein Hanom_Chr03g00211261 [Helianthus anomalus]